ncbi:MAG: glycosyltransferase family 2 protein [Calditrichaeota bacterium]|nr:MAG: glycosyltransferase family 2 protein [Calditrichota bacterium]
MKENQRISVIIPVLNEEKSIGRVLADIPRWVDEVLVVDNGSTDRTVEVAQSHGARVIHEPERGYGAACLAGIAHLNRPDIVVFLDGDYSDYPEEMELLVAPILRGEAEMVIGSRVAGKAEKGALTPQARFGNWLACRLMRLFWGVQYTDLGPFRAIRHSALCFLEMRDRNYGWTVEMQIKAAQRGVRAKEIPVRYRKRIGKSKVSGTIRGVIGAGTKILSTIFLSAIEWHFRGKRRASMKRHSPQAPSPDRRIKSSVS